MLLLRQAVSYYESSLESLGLWIFSRPLAVDFSHLASLTSLKTLETCRNCMSYAGFQQVFEGMRSVTKLRSNFSGHLDGDMSESIASHAELKTLDCRYFFMHGVEDDTISLAPRVTQLTELTVSVYGELLAELDCLTELVQLNLFVYCKTPCRLDTALDHMPHLQELEIRLWDGVPSVEGNSPCVGACLSSSALENMDRLKSVRLDCVDVDRHFFQQLLQRQD